MTADYKFHVAARSLIAAGLMFCAQGALACPEVGEDGNDIFYDSEDLWSAKRFSVVAGGSQDLDACYLDGIFAAGYVARAPDFELHYDKTRNYDLRISAEGNCDTVLLINTGAANWFYDDDGGSGDSMIQLSNPSDGVYDIWIGTYGSSTCNAELEIETFAAD